MINFIENFLNRKKELSLIFRSGKKELPAIYVSRLVKEERDTLCKNCDHLSSTLDICNKSGCLISIIIDSPALKCPIDKWSAILPVIES